MRPTGATHILAFGLMDAVSEIKARLPIEDLVSQYVPLKKVGRQFKALCPFHKERTPSFYVSPDRQLAYCFGCRKGGDHFKFLQEMEGLDFRAALEMLAEKTGVELPKRKPEDFQRKTERDRLMEIHEKAVNYFAQALHETKEGKRVLEYLKKRGLSEETIRNFKLGFAPQGPDDLYKYLLEENFTKDEIVASGLCLAREVSSSACSDRFRMRLMFPIENAGGDICAFGGRAVREGDEPKYLNSPETPLYHKSSVLFGLARARTEIRRKDFVIIVEGYMDALAAHQAGHANTVACSGTALTEDHFLILKRFTKNLVLCFDNDNAGRAAALRSIELGFDSEFSLKVANWVSKTKDPDECLREEPEAFQKSLESALPATQFLALHFKKEFGTDTGSQKKQIVDALLSYLARIKSPVLLDEWLKEIARELSLNQTSLYDELRRSQNTSSALSKTRFSPKNTAPELHLGEVQETDNLVKSYEYLLGLLLTYPESRDLANQLLPPEQVEDIELQNIYRSLTTEYNQSLDAGSAPTSESNSPRANLLAMYAETLLADMTHDAVLQEIKFAIQTILRIKMDREKRGLLARLNTANGSEQKNLLDTYQELLEREKSLWQKS